MLRKLVLTLPFLAMFAAAAQQTGPVIPPDEPLIPGYTTSWLGNTFGGPDKTWVQKDAHSLTVGPDGSCYLTAAWDEGAKAIGIYKDGKATGQCAGRHIWDKTGAEIIDHISSAHPASAADDKYVFIACFHKKKLPKAPAGTKPVDSPESMEFGFRRFKPDGYQAAFDGKEFFLPLHSKADGLLTLGMCLYKDELFVGERMTDSTKDRIRVFDKETLREKRSFPVPMPGRMAVDNSGLLWVISVPHAAKAVTTTVAAAEPGEAKEESGADDTEAAEAAEQEHAVGGALSITQYTLDGKPTGKAITDRETLEGARALAVDHAGHLLIACAQPLHQVLKYDVSGEPKVVGTLGPKYGIYSGVRGEMGDDRLAWLCGVGVDAQDNIYTLGRYPSGGGHVDLRKYSPDGKLQWKLCSITFVDMVDVDPASEQGALLDVYTRDAKIALDLSKPSGEQWTWKAYTLDPRYEDGRDDLFRQSGFTWATPTLRRLNGQLYMYMAPGSFGVFRKGPDECFVPSAYVDTHAKFAKQITDPNQVHYIAYPPVQPKPERWIWRDLNGDGRVQKEEFTSKSLTETFPNLEYGQYVDARGDLWMNFKKDNHFWLARLPLKGFDEKQNPIYDLAALKPMLPPAPFTGLHRMIYDAGSDSMYLSGSIEGDPKYKGPGFETVGPWLIRYDHFTSGKPVERWRIALKPPEGAWAKALCIAGERIFTLQRQNSMVHVYDTNTGAKLGTLVAGPEVGNLTGFCDMDYGISAFKRKNGEYLVFVEEDYHSKILMYRIPANAPAPGKTMTAQKP